MASALALSVSKVMITGVVLLGACFQTVKSLRCYNCDSLVDPGCGDPFGTNYATVPDCSARDNTVAHYKLYSVGCAKLTEKTSDGMKITRKCLLPKEAELLIPPESRDLPCMDLPNGNFLCHCYHDLCNSATSVKGRHVLGLITTAIFIILRFV